MKKKMLLSWSLLLTVFLLTHCTKKNEDVIVENPTDENPSALAPVETLPKVAINQQPAFAGQTRVAGVKTQAAFKVSVFASGLNSARGMDFLPDGRIIVCEKPGMVRIISTSGSLGNAINGVPTVRNASDGGLLDVKVDPDFNNSRWIFLSYTEPNGNTGVNCVARGKLSENEQSLEEITVIYRSTSPYSGFNHNGSRMLFDNQGRLYVTVGDRFDNAIREQAQQLTSSLGKIIRINKDGSAASGNPFANTPNARAEIWSIGHRNPQGLAFNPVTGELWSSDHGPQAGDEINIVKAGTNYGWPVISYGLEYNNQPVSGSGLTQRDGMEQPVYYWDPAIAPSGITFYTGDLIPEWKNNLFVAALRGTHLVRLIINNTTHRIIGEERLLTSENRRMKQPIQGPDGALYVVTDDSNGRIYRISN